MKTQPQLEKTDPNNKFTATATEPPPHKEVTKTKTTNWFFCIFLIFTLIAVYYRLFRGFE